MIKLKLIVKTINWEKSVLLALISFTIIGVQISLSERIDDRIDHTAVKNGHQLPTIPMTTNKYNNSTDRSNIESNQIKQQDQSKAPKNVTGSVVHDKYSRFSYNISYNKKNTTNGNLTDTYKYDDLAVSDSRPRTRLSREDNDDLTFDTATEDEGPTSYGYSYDNDHPDEAGSSLSERRLIKEMTKELRKIVGKSASSSTADINGESLDAWRSKRKGILDARSKIVTDLLSGLVDNNNLDKETRQQDIPVQSIRKRVKQIESGGQTTKGPLNSMLSSYSGSLDPELANDAETVVQHIQSLASVIDGSGHGELAPMVGQELAEQPSESARQSDQDSKQNIFSGGPILRQFKKIKTQISHRRKQLDHIKKIFNVELALNNTSQQSVNQRSKKSQDLSDLLVVGDANSDSKKKSFGEPSDQKLAKVQELMSYLRENPDVLTSVMSELSNEAEPMIHNKIIPQEESEIDEGPQTSYSGSYTPASERKLGNYRRYNSYNDRHRWTKGSRSNVIKPREFEADDSYYQSTRPDTGDRASYSKRPRRAYSDTNGRRDDYNSRSIYNSNSHSHSHSRSQIVPPPSSESKSDSSSASKSPEARLLETLREKQLKNLAKLDRAIAEKQQASNRSSVYSNAEHPTVKARPVQDNLPTNTSRDPTDDEIVHHFMVMNGQNSGMVNGRPLSADLSILDDQDWSQEGGSNNQNKQALTRFNTWRDVSQSEASSSQRSLRADLNSDSPPHRQDQKLVRASNGRKDTQKSRDGISNFGQNTHPDLGFGNDFVGSNDDYADTFITKPGQLTNSPDIMRQTSSTFMTRSSVTDGEPSTETMDRDPAVNASGGSKRPSDDRDYSSDKVEKSQTIDYFSAYKRRNTNQGTSRMNLNPGQDRLGPPKHAMAKTFRNDDGGSMWAR